MVSNPDGDGVVVPGHLAPLLADLAGAGVEALKRRNGGGRMPAGMFTLLGELTTFASETPSSTVVPVQPCASARWVSAGEAAGLAGVSPQRIRYLARTGRIRARRAGRRIWLIDADAIPGRDIA